MQWYERWGSFDPHKLAAVIRPYEAQRKRIPLEFVRIQTELGHPERE